ncbi:hypothetical protein CJ195_04705 [Bacillus sp. UMB0899]|uniref:protein YpmT n=1 Tax=Metabacillus schmidteae TaxID=2730405 RepID=UPI000C7FD4B7|nr:protein YpmT [Metabacillus schmidteae]PMC39236.1 hypothetical protein CJ195_04705 [Bacillus sp. UMB0899]
MKNKFMVLALVAILVSLIFGGIAWQKLVAENMDEVYLNLAYSTMCLSVAFYLWHIKDEKSKS